MQYQLGNPVRLDVRYPKVVSSPAFVYINKEKRVKQDVRSWQKIFIDYAGKNQYCIYNSRTRKFNITRDFSVNEQHLYYRKALYDCYYSDNNWAETDNTQFSDMSNFNDSEISFSLLLDGFPYSVGENTSKIPLKYQKRKETVFKT